MLTIFRVLKRNSYLKASSLDSKKSRKIKITMKGLDTVESLSAGAKD